MLKYDREKYRELDVAIDKYRNLLYELKMQVISEKISNYPIFLYSYSAQSVIGKLLIETSEAHFIYITHLEDLYHLEIITKEHVEAFRMQYKHNSDKLCIMFYFDEESSGFSFVPET
ncbi:MAG: hypothetical protein MUE53_03200 [Chitinophagales bacterium]|jgi:hypothetical protein|nr:hypothetical protein [Chitinophagales bacterium]